MYERGGERCGEWGGVAAEAKSLAQVLEKVWLKFEDVAILA